MRFPGRHGDRHPVFRWQIMALVCVSACSPAPMSDLELVKGIEDFELAMDDQSREIVQELLRAYASTFKGQVVNVQSAVIASRYTRENPSKIYFGVNYNLNDYVFLSEIDPPLHDFLENHQHWVSVVATYPTRQLSYELPIDEHTFEQLEGGQVVTFSCRIAALIRGKSVYCVPIEFNISERPGRTPGGRGSTSGG